MLTRRVFVRTAAVGALAGPAGRVGAAPLPPPAEKPTLTVGVASFGSNFGPIYVGADRTWKEVGFDLSLLGFRGDSEVTQALAGGSIDIAIASLNGVINLISAGQPVMAFYAGIDQADFDWIAQPSIKTWSDLKGKTAGVSTFGSLTDALTRFDLRKHGLEPDRDVKILQVGATQAIYEALRNGRIDLGILSPPFKWMAADAGFTVLSTQQRDIAPRWPKNLMITKTAFLAADPNTIERFLRGYVMAIRLCRSDPQYATGVLMQKLKYSELNARRSLASAMPDYDERGHLPDASVMKTFWQLAIANGDVKEPWPAARFLDPRYIDSFARWAP